MKLSIVIAVLDSHEIVRRQLLHFERMDLPDDVEIVIVDDGSDPPLEYPDFYMKQLKIIRTYDARPWRQGAARNLGVKIAQGDMVLCTDIDHIVPGETVQAVLETRYDVVRFRRYVATLTENGDMADDDATLAAYGYNRPGKRISAHGNSYAIKRELFLSLGGSRQGNSYPLRDEVPIKRQIKRLQRQGAVSVMPDDDRPSIYLVPNGRFSGSRDANPFGLFHGLQR